MKQFAVVALAAVVFAAPGVVSAHETQVFEIGGKMYQFVVGSLNEPLVVDDKSGLDLTVSDLGVRVEGMDHADGHDHGSGGAVTGLEESLQVELIAGSAKKTLDIAPVYGVPGSYKAPFYPTVATSFSYRVFGTVNNTPVSLTFSCSAAGHTTAEEDDAEVEISEGVTRHKKTGAFGCPVGKEVMGFPEDSTSVMELSEKSGSASGMGTAALALSVVSLIVAGYASRKK